MKGETKRVMTCQPTPEGRLAKAIKAAVNQDFSTGRTLVTEDGGQPEIIFLKKTDPFLRDTCRYNNLT